MSSSETKDTGKMKQKSLMSFFGKPQTKANAPAAKPEPRLARSDASSSSPAVKEARTPLSKANSQSSVVTSAMYTRSSDGDFSTHETVPTSDPIDVDMLSDESEGGVQAPVRLCALP